MDNKNSVKLVLTMNLATLFRAIKQRAIRFFIRATNLKDVHYIRAFIKEMNSTAKKLGMNSTKFYNASGATAKSYITAADLMKLELSFRNNRTLAEIWNKSTDIAHVHGTLKRELTVEHTILYPPKDCIQPYFIIAGKSGSWGLNHRALAIECQANGELIPLCLVVNDEQSFSNIYEVAKEILDSVFGINGSGTHLNRFADVGGGYVVCRNNQTFECNSNVKHVPASTTKLMTALCALQYVDLDETISIKRIDIDQSFGRVFYVGDAMTFRDALTIMILESSNVVANAICRTAGEKM